MNHLRNISSRDGARCVCACVMGSRRDKGLSDQVTLIRLSLHLCTAQELSRQKAQPL